MSNYKLHKALQTSLLLERLLAELGLDDEAGNVTDISYVLDTMFSDVVETCVECGDTTLIENRCSNCHTCECGKPYPDTRVLVCATCDAE